MAKIRMAEDQYTIRMATTIPDYRAYLINTGKQRWGKDFVFPKDNWKTKGVPVEAFVASGGDWSLTCPSCKEQIIAQLGEPYYCPECENQYNDNYAVEVIFPSEDNRKEIERLLLLRPTPKARMWLPHENLIDLQDQNIEHGDEI
jgi:hypothetical protein